jgi:hypothetical protein
MLNSSGGEIIVEKERTTEQRNPLEDDDGYYLVRKSICKFPGIDEPVEMELWSKKPNQLPTEKNGSQEQTEE